MQIESVLYTKQLRRVVGGFSYGSLGSLFLISSVFWTQPVYAAPTGGQVTAGSGAISQTAGNTTVNQASQNLSLNWQSFNVGAHEAVNFVQPNTAAIAVNRIADTSASQILGSLSANGQVYLVNPNGIVFGAGAQVNVGGLVASTLAISDSDLASATRHFSGSGAGAIVNRGTITAAPGGYVALLGHQVSNQGTIRAPGGTAALGAGSAVSLSFDANRLLSMQVDANALNALAENKQLIVADGGQVLMSAGAKDSLLASVVNNTGVVQAQTVANHNGQIMLLAGMAAGTTTVNGTLDASAPNGGDGGFIETSGAHVHVADAARISTLAVGGNTGTWLIDPHDYTIAASGGDITGSALSNNLNGSNVEIKSSVGANAAGSGDVYVNDAVSWNANTTLTLKASNNVNINASITATGDTAGLVISPNTTNQNNGVKDVASGTGVYSLNTGASITLSGAAPRLKIEKITYTVINTLGAAGSVTGTDLQGINGGLAGHYALGSNIDASATSGWNGGAGFNPIGNSGTSFSGSFDGFGHTINGVFINRPTTTNVGLFGYIGNTAEIRNVGLTSVNLTAESNVGSLAGYNNFGSISNSYATGYVVGITSYPGGLVGVNKGSISSSYATNTVNGYLGAGGLVGYNIGSINNSYATGQVLGSNYYTGGLVGINQYSGSISNSYATGTVHGDNVAVGGLVGGNVGTSSISNSYATGQVSGSANDVGGLVGASYASISNSYATGQVSGGAVNVGGLVGIQYSGSINQSYATGAVSGPNAGGSIGGLVGGRYDGTVSASYWNTQTTGQNHSTGSADTFGLTSAQMMNASSFAGWDVATTGGSNSVWRIYEGYTAPLLRTFMTNLAVTGVSTTYSGAAYAGSNNTYTFGTLAPTFWLPSTSVDMSLFASNLHTNVPAINAGSYLLNGDLHSSQMGYDIAFTAGTLTINPATLLFTANSANRLYGAANPAFTGSVTGFVGTDTLANATTGTPFSSAAGAASNVGAYAVDSSGLTANNGNYVFTQALGNATALTINPAPLTATANNISTTYDAAAYSGGNGVSYSGFLNGEGADVLGGALVYGGASQSATNVGRYAITPSGLTSGNYTISYVNGALTINPATLMFTANAVSRFYGVANPDFTGSMTGFVGTDTLASATTGTLFWTSPADVNSLAGSYAINGSGLAAMNYVFAQAPGNTSALTVQASAPVAMTMTIAGLIQSVGPQDSGQGDSGSSDSGSSATGHTWFALPGQSSPVEPKLFTVVGSGVRLP